MIKTFQCSNGTVYATSDKTMVSVDEVIDFLEQHRGKMFFNGAAGETSFCVEGEVVTCDELDYHLAEIEFDIQNADFRHDIDLTFNIVLTMAELENQ